MLKRLGLMLAAAALIVPPCQAQRLEPARFAAAQQSNAAALHKYTWKQRVELRLKGEVKKTTLSLMRYDVEGNVQKTPISSDPPAAQQSGRRIGGRLKGRIAENKKEEFQDLIEGLTGRVTAYTHIAPETLRAAVAGAEHVPGEGDLAGTVGLRMANVLEPGDTMTLWVDTKTLLLRRVEIQTTYDKKAVLVTALYASVAKGPTYVGQANVDYPAEQLTIRVDGFDYAPAG